MVAEISTCNDLTLYVSHRESSRILAYQSDGLLEDDVTNNAITWRERTKIHHVSIKYWLGVKRLQIFLSLRIQFNSDYESRERFVVSHLSHTDNQTSTQDLPSVLFTNRINGLLESHQFRVTKMITSLSR